MGIAPISDILFHSNIFLVLCEKSNTELHCLLITSKLNEYFMVKFEKTTKVSTKRGCVAFNKFECVTCLSEAFLDRHSYLKLSGYGEL